MTHLSRHRPAARTRHASCAARLARLTHDRRGSTAAEYALILVCILLAVAVAYKAVGQRTVEVANAGDRVLGGDDANLAMGNGGPSTPGGGAAPSGGGAASKGTAFGQTENFALRGGGSAFASAPVAFANDPVSPGGAGIPSGSSGGSTDNGAYASGNGGNSVSSAAAPPPSFTQMLWGNDPKPIDGVMADLSIDAYTDNHGQTVDGYTRLTDEQLKALDIHTPTDISDTGFRAGVYTDGNHHYVVAYAGTDAGSWKDWRTDIGQGMGFNVGQYKEAYALATEAKSAFGNNLAFTGHSLGGGLASLGAAGTGSPAVTFNAAGLSPLVMAANGVDPNTAIAEAQNGEIRRYNVDGEVLTGLQEHGIEAGNVDDAIGHEIVLPDPMPIPWYLTMFNPGGQIGHAIDLHMMDSVKLSMAEHPPWQH